MNIFKMSFSNVYFVMLGNLSNFYFELSYRIWSARLYVTMTNN